jgi:DNA polymerase
MYPDSLSARYAVIGEAPGAVEDRKGQVFVGRSGQILRRMLRESGLDLDAGAWMNVNACRPPDNRTPEVEEREACEINLHSSLQAANTRYVLLAGASALSAWRRGLKVSRSRGAAYVWWDISRGTPATVGWWVFPTHHPAAVLHQPHLKHEIRADVERFASVVLGEIPASHYLSNLCVECTDPMTRWDEDGVAWCESCWGRKLKKANRGKRVRGTRIHDDQGTLHL